MKNIKKHLYYVHGNRNFLSVTYLFIVFFYNSYSSWPIKSISSCIGIVEMNFDESFQMRRQKKS